MTIEETKSCIGTIEMLQRLAYNIHGVMDVIDADNCKKIIKALEQEPKSEWEYDHEILKAYSDGANEVLDKIRAEIEEIAKDYDKFADYRRVRGLWIALKIIDKYKAEIEPQESEE